MKSFFAVLLISVLTAGCRSLPIQVPDLPPDQLLVNQPIFENAVHQQIIEGCAKTVVVGDLSQSALARNVICGYRVDLK
jgi:hypothetical protein